MLVLRTNFAKKMRVYHQVAKNYIHFKVHYASAAPRPLDYQSIELTYKGSRNQLK